MAQEALSTEEIESIRSLNTEELKDLHKEITNKLIDTKSKGKDVMPEFSDKKYSKEFLAMAKTVSEMTDTKKLDALSLEAFTELNRRSMEQKKG